jgi:hypothetical protein
LFLIGTRMTQISADDYGRILNLLSLAPSTMLRAGFSSRRGNESAFVDER